MIKECNDVETYHMRHIATYHLVVLPPTDCHRFKDNRSSTSVIRHQLHSSFVHQHTLSPSPQVLSAFSFDSGAEVDKTATEEGGRGVSLSSVAQW